MSVESIQPGRFAGAAGYLARVRLPDDTEQDVELGRGRAGELEAKLIDGAAWRSPELRLDFTQGATPRVTWAEPDAVPLATSLQIVGKVCDALARSAGGLEAAPVTVMQVEVKPVKRQRTRERLALGLLTASAISVVVLVLRPAERPAPIVATAQGVAAPVAAKVSPVAPALPAIAQAKKVEAPPPTVAPHRRAHHRRGFRLLSQRVQHGVRGLAPGTGLVALRTEPGLEVAVDGLWVGMTPVHPLALSEGSHVLELRRSGKHAETLELGVAAGDEATLFLRYE